MKKLFLVLTVVIVAISSTFAQQTGYERKAFAGRYGLWNKVHCIADSVSLVVEDGNSLAATYPPQQMQADIRADLEQLAFPGFCDSSRTPAPGTMVSVELEVRTELDDSGSLAYFVRMLVAMPDVDFVRSSYGQHTTWESPGKLGFTSRAQRDEALRSAIASQVEEFSEFMGKTQAQRRN